MNIRVSYSTAKEKAKMRLFNTRAIDEKAFCMGLTIHGCTCGALSIQ